MDVVAKIMLVASILMMGYQISQALMSYKTLCEKAEELKKLASENTASELELRRSNFLLSFLLSLVYVVLAYFSDFTYWIVALVTAKLALTLYLSDVFLVQILRCDTVSQKFYILSKWDAVLNSLVSLALALLLVL